MVCTLSTSSPHEKYKPVYLDDIVGDTEIIEWLKIIAKDGSMPLVIISRMPGIEIDSMPYPCQTASGRLRTRTVLELMLVTSEVRTLACDVELSPTQTSYCQSISPAIASRASPRKRLLLTPPPPPEKADR